MRPICSKCGKNPVTRKGWTKKGKPAYRTVCWSCHTSVDARRRQDEKKRPWLLYKKDHCEHCGFIPLHLCQLDVDHKDGNRNNNDPSNYQTLCANCHRLKTFLNRDWEDKEEQ